MATTLLHHARLYLSLGFAVLPLHFPFARNSALQCSCGRDECRQPAKHPFGRLVRNGLKDASKDPAKAEQWFHSARFNIGIATGAASGIIVLDIDPRHAGDETLASLESEHGPLPATWRFLTGGGGEHIIFRHPGCKIPNSAGAVGPGLDVRGDGGYIVAPPSLHMSGRPYAISVDHHPEDVPLAEAPAWLLERVTATKAVNKARKAAEWRSLTRDGAVDGERNVTIARLSGLLLGRRLDPHICLDLVLAFNATRCKPPLPDDEVVATVASIARRELGARALHRLGGGDHG
ncbi:bifunctional DNA primase/polymerase [Pseudorhodoplanes sp.]|uniref:bifunctional DNA primase/polymerase n=1 Tax=Pseudorhodoplanes sp. TaxID=1934341 RepID=UPI0039196A30